MDFWFLVGLGAFLGIFVVLLQYYAKVRAQKKQEDEYFRRMYWTVRHAHEDAQRSRGDIDKND